MNVSYIDNSVIRWRWLHRVELFHSFILIWAGAQHFLQDCICAQRRIGSDCVHTGWSVFDACLKTYWILDYAQSARRRLWSDCADAQADLSLRWAYMQSCRKCCASAHITINSIFSCMPYDWPQLQLSLTKQIHVVICIVCSSIKLLENGLPNFLIYFLLSFCILIHSRTSMTRTSLGPLKFVLDMGSSSHLGIIVAPG